MTNKPICIKEEKKVLLRKKYFIKHISWQTSLAYILALLLLLLVLLPFVVSILASLKPADDFYLSSFHLFPTDARFENYVDALNFTTFLTFVKNSLVCALIVMVGSTLLSACAAFGFSRIRFFGRNVLFYLFILTQGIPFAVLCVPTYAVMTRLHLVNTVWGLVLPMLAFPMGTFLLRQTMLSIPMDYENAALIDGCNRPRMFFSIFLPMTKNTVIAVAIFSFMQSWNNYIWPLMIVNDKAMYTIPLGLTLYNIQGSMSMRPEWSVILSACIMSVIPIMLVYTCASRFFMDGLTMGGLKG